MKIRIAHGDDARGIAELLCKIDDYPQWKDTGVDTLEQFARDSLAATNDHRSILIAELNERIVGYAGVYWLHPLFNTPEGYVSELFIRSDASGQGIGTALLENIKLEAITRGCNRLTLINLKNRESYKRSFYAKKGWQERPETVRFVLDLEAK
jgi:GNAT superfamily N-acetyltransferase